MQQEFSEEEKKTLCYLKRLSVRKNKEEEYRFGLEEYLLKWNASQSYSMQSDFENESSFKRLQQTQRIGIDSIVQEIQSTKQNQKASRTISYKNSVTELWNHAKRTHSIPVIQKIETQSNDLPSNSISNTTTNQTQKNSIPANSLKRFEGKETASSVHQTSQKNHQNEDAQFKSVGFIKNNGNKSTHQDDDKDEDDKKRKNDFKSARQIYNENEILNGNKDVSKKSNKSKSSLGKRGFQTPFKKSEEEIQAEKKAKIEESNKSDSMVETLIKDERTKGCEPHMIELICSEILDKSPNISFDDVAGLKNAKAVIEETIIRPILRPDIYKGMRKPARGILLFGPPGTGKTLIGKAIASQCGRTFFSISASSLTSKWIGDGEKMVRTLFAIARCLSPSIVFIDEIDSLLTKRNDSENEASRKIKTEFLVQLDGAKVKEDDLVLMIGATNRPQELDEAARRRLVKKLYIPLPDKEARMELVRLLIKNEKNDITQEQLDEIGSRTDGYSGADMNTLVQEACLFPTRNIDLQTVTEDDIRPVSFDDFISAQLSVKATVSPEELDDYVKWNEQFGRL
eukprot:TRINITY_DN3932_c0_g1_i1.p1 TRINITY_DN3932_c0_g1~~TRINITY_DN3932_c0_g1_i1.p1  ORF type:complete len:570 (+),score=140.25 TRINITY_DN3932_c0_g1_i1:182-1891(+)